MTTCAWVILALYVSGVALHWHSIALIEVHERGAVDEHAKFWRIYRVVTTAIWPLMGVVSIWLQVRDRTGGGARGGPSQ